MEERRGWGRKLELFVTTFNMAPGFQALLIHMLSLIELM